MRDSILTALYLVVLWPSVTFGDADTDEDDAQVRVIVSALLSHIVGYDGLHNVATGDIDDDGQLDAVVTYSHGVGQDGGNQHSQRAALLLWRDAGFQLSWHARVGGRNFRTRNLVDLPVLHHILVRYWNAGLLPVSATGYGV